MFHYSTIISSPSRLLTRSRVEHSTEGSASQCLSSQPFPRRPVVFQFRPHCDDEQVVSWDERAGTYDTNVDDGRSYISVISEVKDEQTCLGAAKRNMGEARMDIVSSEMAYLGYYNSESYGLTWKVRLFFLTELFSLPNSSVNNSTGAAAFCFLFIFHVVA